MILGGTSATVSTAGNGYAVVYGSTSTPDPIRLVRYTSGVASNGSGTSLTDICTSAANDLANTNNYASVRVTYQPATNTWQLFVRDDGASAWANPTTGVTSQKGSATVDNTYTGSALSTVGFLFSHATTTPNTGQFDNFTVTLNQPATPSISGFTVASPGSGTSGYVGNTITLSGSGFSGVTSLKVGGSGGTSVTNYTIVDDNTITFPAINASGQIYVLNGSGNATSASSYTNLGYISTAAGNYNTAATWLGGALPVAAANVTIAHAVTASAAITNAAANLTVNTGSSLAFTSTASLTANNVTLSGTGVFTAASGTSTLTIASGGTFSAAAAQTLATGSVVFAGSGTISGTSATSFNNLTLNGATTLTTAPTVTGTLLMNNSAATVSASPNFGSASTLNYAATLTVGNEWTNNNTAPTYPAAGAPFNITVSGGTLTPAAANRAIPGTFSIIGATYTHTGNVLTVGNATSTTGSINISVGTLNVSGGTITLGATGGGNRIFTLISGAFNLTSTGTVNVNGSVNIAGGTFTQSGTSLLSIDGNGTGGSGVSVASGTAHFGVLNGSVVNASAGTIRIVDPPLSSYSTSSTRAVSIQTSSASYFFTSAHTFEFGDGSSSTIGNSDGFVIECFAGSVRMPVNNVVVNAGSGTGRWVNTSYGTSSFGTHINGSLTISSGSEFRNTLGTGALFSVAGNIVNNGTFTSTLTPQLATVAAGGTTVSAASVAQTISGSGVFRNAASSPTGNFVNLTQNNTGGVTLNLTTAQTISITGTFTQTAGKLALGNCDFKAATHTITPSATTYIATTGTGRFLRNLPVSTATTWPVGNSAYNPLVLTNSGTADTLGVRVVDAAPPAANDANFVVNRYWVVTERTAGGNTLNPAVAQYNTADGAGTSFAGGSAPYLAFYDGTTWTQRSATVAGSNPFTYSGGTFSPTDMTTGTQYFAIGKDIAFSPAGTTYTWVGGTSNSWTDPSNWNPNTSIAGPTSADNVVINTGGSPFPLIVAANQSVVDFTLNGTGTFSTNSGVNLTITGNVTYGGSATATLDPASTITISSGASQTIPPLNYGNLNASGGARTFTSGATTGIAGTLTPGSSNAFTGSTIDFNGSGAQTINALNYNNLTISNSRISLPVLTLASGTIGIAGTLSYTATGFASVTNTGNTVDFNGTGSQTIGAFSGYNNLTISGARGTATLTLASGTIGVAGTFNPSATGTLTWVNTGNAIDFNSAGAQTIPVFGFYNDIQNTGNGARTLGSGTVGIAGTYTPTTGAVTVTGNTIDFTSASSQPIPATSYNAIANSGNGDRVWANSGNIDIASTFSPGTGVQTITGSTVRYTATSGTFTLTDFTTASAPAHYNNLVFPNVGATFNLTNGLTIRTLGDFTQGGGTINLAPTGNTLAGGLNVGGNYTQTGGTMNVATGTVTGTLAITGNASFGSTVTIATTGTGVVTVGGNVTHSAGNVNVTGTAGSTTGGGSLSITGNYTNTGGTLKVVNTTGAAPNTTVSIGGTASVSGAGAIQLEPTGSATTTATVTVGSDASFTGTATMVDFGSSAGANEFRIGGNFSKSGTGSFNTAGGTAATGFTFNKSGTQTFSYAGTASASTYFNVASGSTLQFITANQVPFSTSTVLPACSFTVNNGGTLDMQGFTLDAGNSNTTFTLNSGATLKTGIAGGVTAALTNFGAGKRTFNAAANYEFNGSVTQSTGFNTPGITAVNNLTINNTGGTTGVSLDNSPTVNGALTFSNGLLTLGSNTLTLGSSATTSGAGAGKYVDAGSTGTLTRTSIATAASGSFPIGTSGYYLPLTITNQGTATSFSARVKQPQATGTVADNTQIVNAEWAISSTSTNADVSFGWPSGAQAGSFNPAGTIEVGRFSGGTAYNLVASGLSATGSNPYAVTATGVTSFASAAPYVIGNTNAVVAPFTSYTWNGSVSSDWGTAANWTPNGVPGAVDNVTINAQTPDINNNLVITSNRSVTDFSLDNSDASGQPGTITLNAGISLTIAGNVTYGGSATATLDPTSTFLISNASSQTVPPLNYGNLNAAGGARTFTGGATTGIAGTLTPGSSNTLTGSTINFNGTGAQTINALNYNNLTLSGARGGAAITLASGTIDVAGTFDISTLSGYTATVTGNTFNFSGAAGQTIPAFFYNNLSSSNANRTWASTGTIDVAGTFTPGTGTHTVTGSTMRMSASTGTISLTSFTSSATPRHYNNLILAGGATYNVASSFNLGTAADLTVTGSANFNVCPNATANTVTVTGNLASSTSGTITIGSAAGAGTLTVAGTTTISNGLVVGTSTASTGVTNTFNTNALVVSGTGRLNLEATNTSSRTTVNVTTDVTVTSTTTNAIDLGSGTTNGTGLTDNNVVNIGGNFSKSGTGSIGMSGTFSSFAGYFFLGGTTQTWSYSGAGISGGNVGVNAGTTLQLNTDVPFAATPASTNFALYGRLNAGNFAIVAGNSTNGFTAGLGSAVISTAKATGISGVISGFNNALTSWTSPTTFEYTGTNVNTGLSAYGNISSSANHIVTWLGSGTLTLDKAMTVSTLNFTNNGLFYLGANNLTLASGGTLNGAPFSASKMIVTDNTGQFIRNFTSSGIASATLWPIGDGTVYAPATINTLTTGVAGTLGFRTVASAAPNNAPATIYLNRYWRTSITGTTSYSWTGTFGYATSDIVPNAGSEGSLKLNIFDYTTSGWTEYASSSASGGVLTVTAGPGSGSLAATDITGRLDVPIYYRTAAAGPATWSTAATWEISSDPTFVSPAPTTATIAPNATNSAGITVRAGHTVNITGTAVSADQMTIEATGIVNASTAALNIANGTGTDLTVNGTLNVSTASTWATGAAVAIPTGGYVKSTAGISSLATVTIDGTYEHNLNGGTIPTASWADSSYLYLTASTVSSAVTGLTTQSFSNLVINTSVSTTGNLQLPASSTLTVRGNLRVVGTGTILRFSNNAYTISVGGNFIMDGGSIENGNGSVTQAINITGNYRQSAGSFSRQAGTFNVSVTGNYIQTGGTFDFGTAGTATTLTVLGNIVHAGGTIQRSQGTGTLNLYKTSGIQTWSQTSGTWGTGAVSVNVGNGTTTNTVQLVTDVNLGTSAGTTTVNNNATLDFQDKVLSGSGTFSLVSGGTARLGSAYGITSSGTGATSGNVQLTTARNFNQGARYVYSGTVNQVTGNGLPSTLTTGQLSISNTGSSGNNTVTLTTTGTQVPTLNLTSGLFAIGTGQTLTIANAGTVNATGGDFATGATGGTVNVASGSTIAFNGTCNPYNVTTAGGVNFGAGTVTIQNGGTFQINTGGFVSTNAPFYASGSTLKYNVNAVYGRDLEWGASSGRGYPHHVQLSNNTTLNPANTGASKAAVAFRTGGDVTIDAGSSLYMDYSGNNMTVPLVVGANLNLTGNLSGSASSGGNILVGGNWTNNGTGTNFFPNLRGVIFNGASAQTIGGTNTTVPAFDSLSIRNTSGDVTTNLPLKVSRRLRLQSGKLFLGSNTVSVTSTGFTQWDGDTASYVVTNGTGVLKQFIANGGNRFYPVGPDGNGFASVTLTQGAGGTSDSISVTVKNAPAYTNAVNDNTQMVEFEWTITEGNAGGNSLTTNFGWERSGEATNFDRTAGVFHANYTGSNYALRATNSTTGTNPYFSGSISASPYTGNLSGVRFVVGNINGIVPCIQSFAAGDWNTGSNWVGGLVPPLSSNVCLNHAMTLGANPPNPTTVTFNAGAGLNISSGITLTLEPSAAFTNASGSPITLGGSGAVSFSGLAAVNGANAFTFPYLKISGNTNFTTVPTIADSLEINAGGFILTGGVTYGGSSTLVYNTGGSYGRNTEWSATSGNNFPNNVRVRGGTTLDISNGSNTARAIAGSFVINGGSTATMSAMTGNLTVPGNFTLNGTYIQSTAAGGDLVLGGNWFSGSTATLTNNNRDVRFNGTATQTITNAASGLTFGFLTIDNTAGGVDLQSVITVNTFRVNASRTFNLNTDKFIVAAGGNVLINGTFNANSGTIEYTNGGNFTNNGTFNRGTSTLDFIGASAGNIVGSVQTNFHNIRLFPGGGIDFGSGALRGRVSGTFQLRAGSYVTGNAPIYEAGSKLQYAGGGTFNRNLEWDNTYVQKVELTNNTALYVAGGGNTNAGYPATMADSLIIQSGSTLNMSNMTASANVGGNLLLAGTMTLSGNSGSDLNVGGDWVNNSGTFTSNDRLVTFNGSNNAAIKGSSTTTFPFITVDKGINATLTPQVPFTLSRAGGATLRVAGGILNLNGISYTLGGGSNTLRIDSGFAKQQTLRTGGSSISGFNTYRRGNLTSDSLGGKVDFSGGSSETLLALGYNLLSVTGGTTATVNQNTRVADSLIVGTGSTLTFGAGSLKVITRGNILNQGTVTSANSGQVILAGGSTQNMAGSGNYGNLVMNNNANANLSGKPTVTQSLQVLLGKIITGSSDTLILGSSATVTETISGVNQHFVRGNFKTVRTVGTSAETFGGMGVELAAGSNLGTVTVVRTSGSAVTGSGVCCTGHSSINRRWKVEPSVQPSFPDRQLKLYWPSQDDNSQNMVLLQLWKSPDGIAPYNKIGNVQNVSASNPRMAVLNNLPSFSVFTGADDVNPLPLGLLRFAGANVKGIAQLNWTMTNEKNWSGFSVERSTDGKNFAPIGYVAALDNGRATNAYRFADNNLTQNSYYRLRLLSPDGTHDYSEMAFISVDGGVKRSIRLFPNPAAAGAEIAINGLTDLSESVQVEVYGLDGRPVVTLEGILSEVNADLAARVQALPAGMYQVKVSTTEQIQTLRLIKR